MSIGYYCVAVSRDLLAFSVAVDALPASFLTSLSSPSPETGGDPTS